MTRKCKHGPGYRIALYEYGTPLRILKKVYCREETADRHARKIELERGESEGITALAVHVGWRFSKNWQPR